MSPTEFDSLAVSRAIASAANAKKTSRLGGMFRPLGEETVPDLGTSDAPVALPGCWNEYYRAAGFWHDIGWAMDGSGRRQTVLVTNPLRQNELDMMADAVHPLWREIEEV